MTIDDTIRNASPGECAKVLGTLLRGTLTPAFGAATKRELELLVIEAMVGVGYLSANPTVYELIQRLKIGRARARALIYDRELRRQNPETLDSLARTALSKPLLQNHGDTVALDIENPYLLDHLRERLRELGHATDGSFSPSMIRVTPEATASLVESYLDDAGRKRVRNALVKAGVPDKSLKGAIAAVIRRLAAKVADRTGEAIAGEVVDVMSPMVEAQSDAIVAAVKGLFASRR
jgi:hypothetical protein